jgi:mannose-6-phosphate isomerase-like protein (cupin superfamily)
MKDVVIYTKSWCGYCTRAKTLLARKAGEEVEDDLKAEASMKIDELREKTGVADATAKPKRKPRGKASRYLDKRLLIDHGAMQHKQLQFGKGFRVVLGDDRSQAAQMTLGPGETEGGPENRHRGADQWLFVVSGDGIAVVEGERVELRVGTLVLVQRGETHEIRNTGEVPLRTLNFYVPPAYAAGGDELPAGKS